MINNKKHKFPFSSYFTKEDFKQLMISIFLAVIAYHFLSYVDVPYWFHTFTGFKSELFTRRYVHILVYAVLVCEYIYGYISRR